MLSHQSYIHNLFLIFTIIVVKEVENNNDEDHSNGPCTFSVTIYFWITIFNDTYNYQYRHQQLPVVVYLIYRLLLFPTQCRKKTNEQEIWWSILPFKDWTKGEKWEWRKKKKKKELKNLSWITPIQSHGGSGSHHLFFPNKDKNTTTSKSLPFPFKRIIQ